MALWVTVAYSALASSILINAGLVKLTSPAGLVRALREVFPAAPTVTPGAVRLYAVVEVGAGVGLLTLPTYRLASLLVAMLGVCFAILGVAGRLAGSTVPCGCIGGHSDRPLGVANAVMGVALVGVLPLSLLVSLPPTQGSDYSSGALVATSLGSLLLSLWTSRRLALSLLRPASTSAGEGAQ